MASILEIDRYDPWGLGKALKALYESKDLKDINVLTLVVTLLEDGSWVMTYAEELTPESGRMMELPEGCAHGFQALAPDSELLYLHTAFYTPAAEGGVHPEDPRVGINWPLPVGDLSERDRSHSLLSAEYSGLAL